MKFLKYLRAMMDKEIYWICITDIMQSMVYFKYRQKIEYLHF